MVFKKDSIIELSFKGDWSLFKVVKDFDKVIVTENFVNSLGGWANFNKTSSLYIRYNEFVDYLIQQHFITEYTANEFWYVHESFGITYDME